MISNIKAANAYTQASALIEKAKSGNDAQETSSSFLNLVKNYGEGVQKSLEAGEQASLGFLAGTISPTELVGKLTDAETELKTMVKLIEKTVAALDEIRKLPI